MNERAGYMLDIVDYQMAHIRGLLDRAASYERLTAEQRDATRLAVVHSLEQIIFAAIEAAGEIRGDYCE